LYPYNIFNEKHFQQTLQRIEKMEATTKSLWGKMNASQMLAHCSVPLLVAFGRENQVVHPVIKFFLRGLVKKQVLAKSSYKKGIPTFENANMAGSEKEFIVEKTKVITLLNELYKTNGKTFVSSHPFFGPLTHEEWGVMLGKHFDHHLKQFGV